MSPAGTMIGPVPRPISCTAAMSSGTPSQRRALSRVHEHDALRNRLTARRADFDARCGLGRGSMSAVCPRSGAGGRFTVRFHIVASWVNDAPGRADRYRSPVSRASGAVRRSCEGSHNPAQDPCLLPLPNVRTAMTLVSRTERDLKETARMTNDLSSHGHDNRLADVLARLSRVTFVTASVLVTVATVVALAAIAVVALLSL